MNQKLGFSAGALAVTLVTLIILVPFGGQAANEVLVSVVGTATPVPPTSTPVPTPTPAPVTEDNTWTVEANADDYYETDADTALTGGNDIWVRSGSTASSRINIAVRMNNVDIPQGATINSATLRLNSNTSGRLEGYLYGHDVDDSPSLTDVTGLPRTTANVFWGSGNVGTGYVSSPSITAIVQEIVDRAGWVEGNDMTIIVVARDGTQYNFLGDAFESGTTNYSELDANFTYTP